MIQLKRKLYNNLKTWKQERSRKPLLLFGARQVGKTFLLTEQFGPDEFETFHVFNFKKYGNNLNKIFTVNFEISRIITELSILINRNIDIEKDLIIFDEVQECPAAVESLKFFYEAYPSAFIIATGSMLRVKLMSPEKNIEDEEYSFSYPVGKVTELTLYPLNFEEFLNSHGGDIIIDAYQKLDRTLTAHEKFLSFYRDYLFVGGMPEAVKIWDPQAKDIISCTQAVRQVQNDLNSAYKRDFIAKGNLINGTHLNLAYDAMFTQVQHAIAHDETAKRFKFKGIIPHKTRFDQLRGVLDWIENAGLAHKVYVIDSPPLTSPDAFIKHNIFKLVPHDIGLVNAKLQHSYKEIRIDELGLVKGALAEIFVANELKSTVLQNNTSPLISWKDDKSMYEIEFLLKSDDYGVYPIEVKGGLNTKSNSLKKYIELYKPKIAIKLSTRAGGLRESNQITLPIYYAGRHRQFVRQ